MSKLIQLKLVTGEWIIGELVEKLEPASTSYTVKKALQLYIEQRGDGYGLGLAPFDPTNMEGTHEILTHAIVSIVTEPALGLDRAYRQQTSGIQLASSMPATDTVPANKPSGLEIAR